MARKPFVSMFHLISESMVIYFVLLLQAVLLFIREYRYHMHVVSIRHFIY